MTIRHVTRRVVTFSAAVAMTGTVVTARLSPRRRSPRDLRPGSEVPGSALPIGTFTAGPFASGQVIEVKIPANSTLTPGAGINIVECAAPGGVAPTTPSACDGNTIQGDTVFVGTDGSVDYTNVAPNHGYTVYALPDANLGESSSGTPVCNLSNECVLYIGQNYNDFTHAALLLPALLRATRGGRHRISSRQRDHPGSRHTGDTLRDRPAPGCGGRVRGIAFPAPSPPRHGVGQELIMQPRRLATVQPADSNSHLIFPEQRPMTLPTLPTKEQPDTMRMHKLRNRLAGAVTLGVAAAAVTMTIGSGIASAPTRAPAIRTSTTAMSRPSVTRDRTPRSS